MVNRCGVGGLKVFLVREKMSGKMVGSDSCKGKYNITIESGFEKV